MKEEYRAGFTDALFTVYMAIDIIISEHEGPGAESVALEIKNAIKEMFMHPAQAYERGKA